MQADDRTAIEKTIAFSIVNCVIQQCQEAAHKYINSPQTLLFEVMIFIYTFYMSFLHVFWTGVLTHIFHSS
jgi:hypothetical protein